MANHFKAINDAAFEKLDPQTKRDVWNVVEAMKGRLGITGPFGVGTALEILGALGRFLAVGPEKMGKYHDLFLTFCCEEDGD